MNVEITREVKNPLLHRTDVYFTVIDSPATPKRLDVKKKIIALKNADPSRVIVDNVKQESGKKESSGYAKVYDSEESMKEIEPEYKIKRNTFEAKEDSKEQAKEAPKEKAKEAPAKETEKESKEEAKEKSE